MASARRDHLTTDFIRSPFISERRRKLFPGEDCDVDSELGHMSPIRSDNTSEDSDHEERVVNTCDTPMSLRSCSETMSPLKLSPYTCGYLRETPRKFSPSHNLKTPHDTSTKPVLEKEQKVLLEESKSLKRKCSPETSPVQNKSAKTDFKASKVRTALFPPENPLEMSLSTKSFYSKTPEPLFEKRTILKEKYSFKPLKLSTARHSYRNGRKFGQINNGVRHKIRKPKLKKISKAVIAKATKKMLETNSALNEYIQDLSELKAKQNAEHKLIQQPVETKEVVVEDPEIAGYLKEVQELQKNLGVTRKLISTPSKITQTYREENKENISRKRSVSPLSAGSSPDDKKSRKFFKSSRSRATSAKVIENKHHEPSQEKPFVLPVIDQTESKKITLDSTNDFDDEETEVGANIDNILSVLNAESPEKSSDDPNSSYNVQKVIDFDSGQPDIIPPSHDDITIELTSTLPENIAPEHTSRVVFAQHCEVPSRFTLEAHNSILASENSIHLHQANIADTILSPISQMCDVTSGLALSSPRGGRDVINSVLSSTSRAAKMISFSNRDYSADMTEQKRKLYPIFERGATSGLGHKPERGEKRERETLVKRGAKRFKALAPDQMLLDAGQKRFGLSLCSECNMIYHMGDPNDEIEHTKCHNAHHILRFAGWKNEHVVADFQNNGRIIKVLPTDSKIWLKKVKDIVEVAKRELGNYDMGYDLSQSEVYLYIKNRAIAGCIVATIPKERGYRMLSSQTGVAMCSEESYPIKCGISLMWVAPNFRKQGVASALIDTVKKNFAYGTMLSNNDIALTSPTEAGAAFAEKYFKTPHYLIYYS